MNLWVGCISSKEGALRLLLIIDYIFDWARDIYRESIITELRNLGAPNPTSLGNDSEIFSMVDRVVVWSTDEQQPSGFKVSSESEKNPLRY